jgi:NADPH:quinone reductase
MLVAEVTAHGPPEVLRIVERPDPTPGPGEVVVRIRAANINPTDVAVRSGQHPRSPQPPFVPGWDLAGEIVAVGERVEGFATGQRVVGMIPWGRIGGRVGAYAEAAAVDPTWLAPLDGAVEDAITATVPLNALTARQAVDLIDAPPGSTVLITGATGAVGGFATQLAVGDGYRVLAQASTGDEDWVASLGATEVVHRSTDLATVGPVDAVLDAVPLGPASTACLRDGGTAVFTRPPGAAPDRDLRFETVLVETDPASLRWLTTDLVDGRLHSRVAAVLPLAEASRAHELNEAGGLRGKVVLTP